MLSDIISDNDKLFFQNSVSFIINDNECDATVLWEQGDVILDECLLQQSDFNKLLYNNDSLQIFVKSVSVYKKILYQKLSNAFDGDGESGDNLNNIFDVIGTLREYSSSPPLSLFKNMYNHIINEWKDTKSPVRKKNNTRLLIHKTI
jgi:hypothetical protein